jgi:hypothetical protein
MELNRLDRSDVHSYGGYHVSRGHGHGHGHSGARAEAMRAPSIAGTSPHARPSLSGATIWESIGSHLPASPRSGLGQLCGLPRHWPGAVPEWRGAHV